MKEKEDAGKHMVVKVFESGKRDDAREEGDIERSKLCLLRASR